MKSVQDYRMANRQWRRIDNVAHAKWQYSRCEAPLQSFWRAVLEVYGVQS